MHACSPCAVNERKAIVCLRHTIAFVQSLCDVLSGSVTLNPLALSLFRFTAMSLRAVLAAHVILQVAGQSLTVLSTDCSSFSFQTDSLQMELIHLTKLVSIPRCVNLLTLYCTTFQGKIRHCQVTLHVFEWQTNFPTTSLAGGQGKPRAAVRTNVLLQTVRVRLNHQAMPCRHQQFVSIREVPNSV